MPDAPNDRLFLTLASLATLLAGVSATAAWVLPDLYANDPAAVRPQLYGQDVVTLLAVVVTAASIWLTARGSVRARVVVLGGMLYFAYGYMMYAFGVRFNALFLPYVATLATATFALALGMARFPLGSLDGALPARRSLAVFLAIVPLLFGTLWLVDIGGAYLSGGIPNGAAEVQMPTSPVHVEDLAFVLPLSAASAVLLWRRSAWAPVFAGVVLVKAITISLAMLAMGLFSWRAGEPVNLPVAGAALVTLAVAAGLAWAYFRGLPRRIPEEGLVVTATWAWLLLAAGGVANGAFRQAVLSPALGEKVARILSIALLVGIVLGVSAWMVARRWRTLGHGTLLLVGASWAVGSALFELGLGRLVFDMPWSELLAAYDLLAGQYWVLAPLAMTFGPSLAKTVLAARTRRAHAGHPGG